MINYPNFLPLPNVAGAQNAGSPTFLRTNIAVYTIVQRKQFNPRMEVAFNFICTNRLEMQEFSKFYYLTTYAGLLEFEADWPVNGDNTTKIFRFADVIVATALGEGVYSVSCKFEMVTRIQELLV